MLKSLPANPSLRQLKQQARDLQRDMRAAAPDAFVRLKEGLSHLAGASDAEIREGDKSLTSAQLVVAREYGFAGWTDLNRYIESRHAPGGRYHYTGTASSTHSLITSTANGDVGEMEWLLSEDPARISAKGQVELFYPGEFEPIHVWAGKSAPPSMN